MGNKWLAAAVLAAVATMAGACSSSSSTPSSSGTPSKSASAPGSPASAAAIKTAKVGTATVLTSPKGLTLYSFAPDTATTSKCNAGCAEYWPPQKGPATAGAGVTGKLATIKRADGSAQATYNGHPLYTYVGDSGPGQAHGNGLNINGGLWRVVTASGSAAPASSPSAKSGGGGY
jgi:predicted lipoprotein with Yx(FWY)xxD motif